MLGRRVGDHVGPLRRGALDGGRGEGVVDHEADTRRARNGADGRDIHQRKGRIGRGFAEEHTRLRLHSRLPRGEVGSVDKGVGDAVPGQQAGDDLQARAEQRPRGDDVIARPQLAGEGGVHGGHPAGQRNAALGAFQRSQPTFEQADGRIAVA